MFEDACLETAYEDRFYVDDLEEMAMQEAWEDYVADGYDDEEYREEVMLDDEYFYEADDREFDFV